MTFMNNNPLLSEVVTDAEAILNPEEFTPLGPGSDFQPLTARDIPQTLDDLTTQVSRTFDLSVTAAGQLNIPVIGSVSGGFNRRVVVLERTAYKEIPDNEIQYQYGYTIRLAITVSKITAEVKMSLPFLAASTELGQIEAKWILQVMGLSGSKIDSAVLPPKELNLETFVLANQSLDSLIKAVRDPTTNFKAALVAVVKPAEVIERETLVAIGKAYALGRLEKGRKRIDALDELGSIRDEIRDAIIDTYKDFAGITSDIEVPSAIVRSRAASLLGPIKVEPR
jgi:hypothetical protein